MPSSVAAKIAAREAARPLTTAPAPPVATCDQLAPASRLTKIPPP